MKYFLTKNWLYIQHDEHSLQGIPIDNLSNDELGEKIRELAETGAEYDKDIHIDWKINIKK
jgi:hypothetical protein